MDIVLGVLAIISLIYVRKRLMEIKQEVNETNKYIPVSTEAMLIILSVSELIRLIDIFITK